MGDLPFIGADGGPALIECAVLFFDLLGVSAMTQGADADAELLGFDKTIRSALPYPIGDAVLTARESAYPASVFSDSVVAAVPVEAGLSAAQAVFQLVFDVARLQADLAIDNYFARGAITLDRFHFHDGLIFGPALVEAVSLERNVAGSPRIILSPSAAATLQEARRTGDPFGDANVLIDEDGLVLVDYLGGALAADTALDLTQKLTRHRDTIATRLRRHQTNFGRWVKHRWVAEYHNATCRRYRNELASHGGYEEFLVERINTVRHFATLGGQLVGLDREVGAGGRD